MKKAITDTLSSMVTKSHSKLLNGGETVLINLNLLNLHV